MHPAHVRKHCKPPCLLPSATVWHHVSTLGVIMQYMAKQPMTHIISGDVQKHPWQAHPV